MSNHKIEKWFKPSYKKNNLGKNIYNVVLEYRPKKIVEFGNIWDIMVYYGKSSKIFKNFEIFFE